MKPLLLCVAGCLLQGAAAGCNKNKHCSDDEFCYSTTSGGACSNKNCACEACDGFGQPGFGSSDENCDRYESRCSYACDGLVARRADVAAFLAQHISPASLSADDESAALVRDFVEAHAERPPERVPTTTETRRSPRQSRRQGRGKLDHEQLVGVLGRVTGEERVRTLRAISASSVSGGDGRGPSFVTWMGLSESSESLLSSLDEA